jgi:hypothetical protein
MPPYTTRVTWRSGAGTRLDRARLGTTAFRGSMPPSSPRGWKYGDEAPSRRDRTLPRLFRHRLAASLRPRRSVERADCRRAPTRSPRRNPTPAVAPMRAASVPARRLCPSTPARRRTDRSRQQGRFRSRQSGTRAAGSSVAIASAGRNIAKPTCALRIWTIAMASASSGTDRRGPRRRSGPVGPLRVTSSLRRP